MSYLVLARKFRPDAFDAIVGQAHVTQTLKNAIRLGRVHHAYLFCGARGVGKTTAARILAKAMNCVDGPTTEPCGTCDSCREIAAGSSIDVFEIDGASNRGISEIRELREGIRYSPSRDRYKVYIIDEVHMLTQEAFNALLKTLEEPPSHALFIFATTEPQKIPVTILSRCQRFDFKRIPLSEVVEYLGGLLAREDVRVDAEGLRLIARESEGSMRDALSLLDQVIAFAGRDAVAAQVAEILGVADRRWLHDLLRAIFARDGATALGIVSSVHHFGFSLEAFTNDFLQLLRDLVALKLCGAGAGVTDLSDEEAATLLSIAGETSIEDLHRLLQLLLDASAELHGSPHPRLIMEMALVRMTHMRPLQPVDLLLKRIARLERALATGRLPDAPPLAGLSATAAVPAPALATTVTAPVRVPVAPSPSRAAAEDTAEDGSPDGPAPGRPDAVSAPSRDSARAEPAARPGDPRPGDPRPDDPRPDDPRPDDPGPDDPGPDDPGPDDPGPDDDSAEPDDDSAEPDDDSAEPDDDGAEPDGDSTEPDDVTSSPAAPESERPAPRSLDATTWSEFVDEFARASPRLAAVLTHAAAAFDEGVLRIAFRRTFDHDQLAEPEAQATLAAAAERFTGRPWRVETRFLEEGEDGRTLHEAREISRSDRRREAETRLRSHDAVRRVVDAFQGRLERVTTTTD